MIHAPRALLARTGGEENMNGKGFRGGRGWTSKSRTQSLKVKRGAKLNVGVATNAGTIRPSNGKWYYGVWGLPAHTFVDWYLALS